MKRQVIPMLAILLLVGAATLAAQSSQPPGHLQTPGATATTGTVVTVSSNALILRTDSGETRTFLIDEGTVGVKDYPADTRVNIDYVMDDQGRSIAKVIMGPPVKTQAPEASTTNAPETRVEVREPEPDLPQTESARADEPEPLTEQETSAVLPQTASKLPLVALVGLLALGASLIVARFS